MKKYLVSKNCREILMLGGNNNSRSVLDLYDARFFANEGLTDNARLHLSAGHNVVQRKHKYIKGIQKRGLLIFIAQVSNILKTHETFCPCKWDLIAVSFVNRPVWKLVAEKLIIRNKSFQSINILKHYVTMKIMISRITKEEKQFYTVPLFPVSLGLIQKTVQNKKLIGVFEEAMKSWSLAVRGYNST